jgi:hypothetical protein
MSWKRILALCGIASLVAPWAVAATSSATPAPVTRIERSAPPDPLDPASAVLPLPHRSVWPSRASAADADPVDWRAAHEAVRRAGGWRAYAREVQR